MTRSEPSPEAIRRATLTICKFLAEDHPGVEFVPAEPDDPDAVLLEFGREAVTDGRELRPRRRRLDNDAQ